MRSILLEVYDVMNLDPQYETVYDVLSLSNYPYTQTCWGLIRQPGDHLTLPTHTDRNTRTLGQLLFCTPEYMIYLPQW